MQNNPYSTYKQQSIMTMTSGEMLLKLYDEVVKQLGSAKRSIDDGDMSAKNLSLQKSQTILTYLNDTLDKRYAVSESLSSLYEFFIEQTIAANVGSLTKPLDDIIPLVAELRDTFAQADKLSRMSAQQQAVAGRSNAISAVG